MEPSSCPVNKGGGAGHVKCRHFVFVRKEGVQRRKAGLTWEDADWSGEKAVWDPSDNPIPEDRRLARHGGVRYQEVGTRCQDGEDQA